MADFWAKKLGQPAAPQQPAYAPQQAAPASSQPWWSQSTAPVQQQPQQPVQSREQEYVEELHKHTKSARKARGNQERCPNCDSPDIISTGSVFTQHGQVESKRCFDCGWPKLQQFSGMGSLTEGKAVGRTRQVEHGGISPMFSGGDTQAPAFAAEHGGPGR